MNLYRYLLILCFIIPVFIMAQEGPAGVGNSSNNGLWLRADKIQQANNTPVSNWPDVSGNANNADQATSTLQPVFFESSALNGQAVVTLDGSNDQLIIADDPILDGSTGLTYYAVVRPKNLNNAPRGILGKRITYSSNSDYAYTWFFYSNARLYNDLNTANNRYHSGPTTYANNNNYILSFDFDGSQPAAKRSRMYHNGNISNIASESSSSIINSNQDVVLGALNANYGTYLGADYAEVIQFNYSLDSLEHILVSNYLSSKYNINLSSNDLYVQDNGVQGDHDFDVAGIGRINSGMIVNNAKGCSILRISNPNDLNDDEFLIWGHNNGNQIATNTSDIPTGIDARFEREWRVSEVDGTNASVDVGSIDLEWDLSSLGSVTASDLRLLVDTDNDGVFSDETPISGATSAGSGLFVFSGITQIADSLKFTLATIDQPQTALPVEYLSFWGESFDNQNKLNWTTVSEINNEYFELEKSIDLKKWKTVASINSKGNVRENNNYSALDRNVDHSNIHYRLKQTDSNGQFSYSKIILINGAVRGEMIIYPNPTSETLTLKGNFKGVRIFNEIGTDVTNSISVESPHEHLVHLSVGTLPNGVYFIHSENGIQSFMKI